MARLNLEKVLVELSLPHEPREFVEAVAQAIEARLGAGTVFIPHAEAAGHTVASVAVPSRPEAALKVVSTAAQGRTRAEPAPVQEWGVASPQAIHAQQEESRPVLVLPAGDTSTRLADSEVRVAEARRKPAGQTAELIINRLRVVAPEAARAAEAAANPTQPRRVWLARTTADLAAARDRLKAFLEDLGWVVAPAATETEPAAMDPASLAEAMKDCLAFVQLLGPVPAAGGLDYLQYDTAAALRIPAFRLRSPDIDVGRLEVTHGDFLDAPDVIAAGFEDFKAYLRKELTALAQRAESKTETLGGR